MAQEEKKIKERPAAKSSGKKIEVELVRSMCQTPEWMRTIVKTMGLRKMRDISVFNDSPSIRGMVRKVPHLVELRERGE